MSVPAHWTRGTYLSAMSWITDRCEPLSDERVQMILKHLQKSMECKAIQGWQTVEEDQQEEDTLFGPLTEEIEEVEAVDTINPVERKGQRLPMFVVVNNGSKCRRLHKSRGGCWMGREMNFKSSVEFNTLPNPEEYTHYCKVCWPKTGPDTKSEVSSSSSSTSSSRSASSSSS